MSSHRRALAWSLGTCNVLFHHYPSDDPGIGSEEVRVG